jgi:hypothetical protein
MLKPPCYSSYRHYTGPDLKLTTSIKLRSHPEFKASVQAINRPQPTLHKIPTSAQPHRLLKPNIKSDWITNNFKQPLHNKIFHISSHIVSPNPY